MPYYMATYHAGPLGLGPNVPARWQHGATPGVKGHSAWVAQGAERERTSNTTSVIVFECENQAQANAYVNWLRPFCPKIEVSSVTDYMPQIQNYEAGQILNWAVGFNPTEEQKRAAREVIQRYIDAPSPAEAIRIYLETEPVPAGPGGAQLVRNLQVAKSLNLE
ncbi:MAG TPA: hypothetical protein VI789_05870 [Dehalococcoidia bacterium]|nr:hypothetical protein [Dehalococcoidia bacterium]